MKDALSSPVPVAGGCRCGSDPCRSLAPSMPVCAMLAERARLSRRFKSFRRAAWRMRRSACLPRAHEFEAMSARHPAHHQATSLSAAGGFAATCWGGALKLIARNQGNDPGGGGRLPLEDPVQAKRCGTGPARTVSPVEMRRAHQGRPSMRESDEQFVIHGPHRTPMRPGARRGHSRWPGVRCGRG